MNADKFIFYRCKAMENYVQKCAVKDPNIIVNDWRSMHLCGKIF